MRTKTKKSIYDTPEMEIKALRKELNDAKRAHQVKSEHLKNNALKMSLKEISIAKQNIDVLRKLKLSILKKIDKLLPTLFDE